MQENTDQTLDRILQEDVTEAGTPAALLDTYRISTSVFEGPLDLLLHLIRKDELNLYDIPIAHICSSYMKHLEAMFEPDVNVAAEFFVMAATLTQIKSQMLLPIEEGAADDDPRMPLVAQLLEYARYKKASTEMDQRPWLGREIFVRTEMPADDLLPQETKLDSPLESVDNFQLLLCLKIALDRTHKPKIEIDLDTTSIRDKVIQVTELLTKNTSIHFEQLFPSKPNVNEVIVSFLAILELARLKFIEIAQLENYGPIEIRSVRALEEVNYGLLDQY